MKPFRSPAGWTNTPSVHAESQGNARPVVIEPPGEIEVADADRAAAGCIFSSALCALCKWRGNTVCLYNPTRLNTATETAKCEEIASILIANAMSSERKERKDECARIAKAIRDIRVIMAIGDQQWAEKLLETLEDTL